MSQTAKQMIMVIVGAVALLIIGAAIYYRSPECLPFALGSVLGGALNAAKVAMLEHNINSSADMEVKDASNYMRAQYLLRFFLTGAVLTAGALVPFISIWGTAAGILTLQLAVFLSRFMERFTKTADTPG